MQASYLGLLKESGLACWACQKASETRRTLLRCAQCRIAAYCGRDCQRSDWPKHKSQCAEMRCQTRRGRLRSVTDKFLDYEAALVAFAELMRPMEGVIYLHTYNLQDPIFRGRSADTLCFDFQTCPCCLKSGRRKQPGVKRGCVAFISGDDGREVKLDMRNEDGHIPIIAVLRNDLETGEQELLPHKAKYLLADNREQPVYRALRSLHPYFVSRLMEGDCSLVLELKDGKAEMELVFHGCFHSVPQEDWSKLPKKHSH
jgi:hypothetical protein